MNGKTAVWICAALLAVSLGLLLPGLVLQMRDERLASAVQTVEIDTVDLSLLSDLSVEELLYLTQAYESRVALEQGREMDAESAVAAAEEAVTDVYALILGNYQIQLEQSAGTAQAVPWLYMGQDGQNAIIWEIEQEGFAVNPREVLESGGQLLHPVTVTALVDDLSGTLAGMNIYWSDYGQEVTEVPAEEAEEVEAVANPGASDEMDESYAVAAASEGIFSEEAQTSIYRYLLIDVVSEIASGLSLGSFDILELNNTVSGTSVTMAVYLTEDMAGYTQSGGSFTVPVSLTWAAWRFNL